MTLTTLANLRRWWWIPAGLLVGFLIGAAVDSAVVWIVVVLYLPANLLGTGLLLRELHDQAPGPGKHPERWLFLVQVAFVVQLPVGLLVLVLGGT